MQGEVSTRVTRALFQVLLERGIDPSSLIEIAGRDGDYLSGPDGWLTNEELTLMLAQAKTITGDPNIGLETGKRVAFGGDAELDRAILTQVGARETLSHFPRFAKLIDRNHRVEIEETNGRKLRLSISRANDGLHTRDHCLLARGVMEGILIKSGVGSYRIGESHCQVRVDMAGPIDGREYEFGEDGRLKAREAGGLESDMGEARVDGEVEVCGTAFGSSRCEYVVEWDDRSPSFIKRLAASLSTLFKARDGEDVGEEEYKAIFSLGNHLIKWESSFDVTRAKYLAYLLLALFTVFPAAWFFVLSDSTSSMAIGLLLSALVLVNGIYTVRVVLVSLRQMATRAENAESILEGSGVSVVKIDPDYTIIFSNRYAKSLHGEIVGLKCYEAFRWDTSPCPDCKIEDVLAGGGKESMEREYLDKNGRKKWNYVTLNALLDEDGSLAGVSHAAVDVQDKKELELELNDKTVALEESEAKYRNYMRNAADAILIHDLDFTVIESNWQMAQLLGLDPNETTIGRSVLEYGILPKAEHERIKNLVSRMLEDGYARQFEMEIIRRDGRVIDVEVRSIPIFIGGKAVGIQSIYRDITARKREEFEKNLLLSISQSIKEAPDLNSLAQNALTGICTIMGVPVAALFVQDSQELKLLAHQSFSAKSMTEIAAAAADWSASGLASRSALFKKSIFIDDASDLKLTAGTRKKLATMGLKSLLSEPLVVDGKLEGVIVLMSTDASDFTEERRATIKHMAIELAMGVARQKLLDVIQNKNKELMCKNEELESATMQLLQSEKMASIGQLAAGVAHEINNPMGYISSNLNVLDEYRRELLKLFRTYDDVLDSIGDLERSGSRDYSPTCGYEAIMEAAGDGLDDDYSDFLSRLRAIREELDPDELFEEFENIIRECQEGASRVKAIVLDLREFSHPESGKPEWLDVQQGLASTLNIVWNELKYKAEVLREFDDVPPIKGYPQELNQVFMNLLINASHAIPEHGEIRLKTYKEDDHVCVQVSDTGSGIKPELMNRIFDPFFTTKEVGKGTGLGLAISYRIVQKHGGQIKVKSEEGKGTTFTIRLPITGPEIMKEAS